MDDNTLIHAVAKGDDVALRELFERHAPWIAARLRRILPRDVVEDALQETFIAIWKSARSYKGQGQVSAWIWGIARRKAAERLRQRGRLDDDLVLDVTGTEDPAREAADKADLQRALATLGPPGSERRELVRLLWEEGHPVSEVASRLGIPEGTVKSRVFHIRRLLKTALQGGL